MANYHVEGKTMTRTKGHDAVRAAAYRAGARLVNERTGRSHDYSRRKDVVCNRLVGWPGLPSDLWNAVEAREKRKDSQLAREFIVALPHELSSRQREDLAMRQADAMRERWGVAVMVSIHDPAKKTKRRCRRVDPDGEDPDAPGAQDVDELHQNKHTHFLVSTRETTTVIGPDGQPVGVLGDRVTILNRPPSSTAEIRWFREMVCTTTNEALAAAGHEARVDHRSLAARAAAGEIAPEMAIPKKHLGPKAAALEKRGRGSRAGDHNRRIDDLRYAARMREALAQEIREIRTALELETTRGLDGVGNTADRHEQAEEHPALPAPMPPPAPHVPAPPKAAGSGRRAGEADPLPSWVMPLDEGDDPAPEPEPIVAAAITVPLDRKQRFKLEVLRAHYAAELPHRVGHYLHYVDTGTRPIRVALRDGTRIRDDGRKVSAQEVTDATAEVMIAMAVAAGMVPPHITGTDPKACDRLWLAARRAGLEPTGHRPSPAARQAWDRQIQVQEAGTILLDFLERNPGYRPPSPARDGALTPVTGRPTRDPDKKPPSGKPGSPSRTDTPASPASKLPGMAPGTSIAEWRARRQGHAPAPEGEDDGPRFRP